MSAEPVSAAVEIRPSGPPRAILLALAGLSAIVVLALAALALRPGGSPIYPPDSPEAAFQGYLTAYEAGDIDTAYGYFSTTVRETMTPEGYREIADMYGRYNSEDRRIVLDGVERAGDRVTLRLRIDHFSADGIGGNRYSFAQEVRLVAEDGAWKLDELLAGIEPAGLTKY